MCFPQFERPVWIVNPAYNWPTLAQTHFELQGFLLITHFPDGPSLFLSAFNRSFAKDLGLFLEDSLFLNYLPYFCLDPVVSEAAFTQQEFLVRHFFPWLAQKETTFTQEAHLELCLASTE